MRQGVSVQRKQADLAQQTGTWTIFGPDHLTEALAHRRLNIVHRSELSIYECAIRGQKCPGNLRRRQTQALRSSSTSLSRAEGPTVTSMCVKKRESFFN